MQAVNTMAEALSKQPASAWGTAAEDMYTTLEDTDVIKGVKDILQQLQQQQQSTCVRQATRLLTMLQHLKAVPLPLQLLELLWQMWAQPTAPDVQLSSHLQLLQDLCLIYQVHLPCSAPLWSCTFTPLILHQAQQPVLLIVIHVCCVLVTSKASRGYKR
jgi:hypothetical protein